MGLFYNPPPSFIGGTQPLAPKVSVPDALSPVVGPQLSGRAIALFASVLALWVAPDPMPFMGGQQPLQARTLPPALLDVPVNDPPFSSRHTLPSLLASWQIDPLPPWAPHYLVQPLEISFTPASRSWLQPVVAAWSVPGTQPQSGKTLSPGIPGQSVDNPPQTRAFQPLVLLADPAPILPRQLSPGIPGQSVDQPPQFRFESSGILRSWQPIDPNPVQRGKSSPGIPGQSIDAPPPLKALQPQIVPVDQAPTLPRQLSPGIPGQSVDNPPQYRQVSITAPAFDLLPQLPIRLGQPFTPSAEAQPYALSWLSTILSAWTPPYSQPVLPRTLNPSVTAVEVNDPPFGLRSPDIGRWLEPNFVQPLRRLLPQEFIEVVYTPLSRQWFSVVLQAWQPADIPPIHIPQLSPGIPGQSIDNPPRSRPLQPQVVLADPPAIMQRQLSPGIPGQSVDNPPALQRPSDLATAWRELPAPQLPVHYAIQVVAEIAAQPFAPSWLGTILQSWQAADPRFDRPRLLPPDITAVAVNDPPFTGKNNWLPSILLQWRAPDPLPWQPFFVSASWNETPIPPVGGGQLFTVSGPSSQDLFGPTVGVSYTWSGTSHRTV